VGSLADLVHAIWAQQPIGTVVIVIDDDAANSPAFVAGGLMDGFVAWAAFSFPGCARHLFAAFEAEIFVEFNLVGGWGMVWIHDKRADANAESVIYSKEKIYVVL
jgi:hypothetical protein